MKKQPTTILIDQDPWITKAISKELLLIKHAFCIWHITAKFSGWFTSILRNQYYKENCIEFVLQYYKDETSQKHKVLWDCEVTNCSCKHFEFWGILCRHILNVFLHKDCYHIPPMYLPSRWCCEASSSEKELLVLDDLLIK